MIATAAKPHHRGAQVSAAVMLGFIFGAARDHCGLRMCGWCGRWLGLARELAEGAVSHGMCDACAQEFSGAGSCNDPAAVSVGRDKEDPTQPAPAARKFLEVAHDA
jgi:hypothetical protein